jgi:hypothetical protein
MLCDVRLLSVPVGIEIAGQQGSMCTLDRADLGAAKNLHAEIDFVVVYQFTAVPAAPDAVER